MRFMKRNTMKFALLTAAILLAAPCMFAQHNNRSARDLQFQFRNPGARSLGFGGAFIGLADDATAPVANPAGMVRTSRRSASLEFNYNRMDNRIPFQGGQILQTDLFAFDFNFEESEAPEDTFQVPYLAVVFPHDQIRYGFFVHQQANLERSYRTDPIAICYLNAPFYPDCDVDNASLSYNPSTDILNLEILNYGGSFAWSPNEKFSLGTSLFYSTLDYRADSIVDFRTVVDVVAVERLARGDDDSWGGIAGLLWQFAKEMSLGITYKYQPEFQYQATLRTGRPLPNVPPDFSTRANFKIPDSLGIGFSFTPLDPLTVNVDANRVFYSQITDDFLDFTQVQVGQGQSRITQTMPDVTEIHFGLEYIFTQTANPVSLRVGYWLDPYHAATNNVEDSQLLEGNPNQPVVRDIFFLHEFEEDENHYALGIGWTLGQAFQFDAAVEIADHSKNATVSGIYRF